MTDVLLPEVRDLLALHLVPGLGPRLTTALLERFGSPGAVLRARADELRAVPHIGPTLSEAIAGALSRIDIDAELALMAKHDTRLLALGQTGYPASLVDIPGMAHLLYLRGTLEPRDANAIGIVGSRTCTAYGKRVAERIAIGLVRAGFTVVSGLARGIDGVAHRAALQAGGRTIAVLAGGLSKIYPPEHADLAKEVQASGGLMTEATMGQEPMAGMFPERNRIISGLSRGVVIVEAAEKSGALITATHADKQSRPIFAVPGPVDSSASAGTNDLIRSKNAILVRDADDILEALDGVRNKAVPVKVATPPEGIDDNQRRIWELLADQPRHLDEITQQLQLPVMQVSAALFGLEMKKAARRLPGNRYERR